MTLMYHGKDRYRSLQKVRNLRTHAESKGVTYLEYDFEELAAGMIPRQALLRLEQDLETRSLFVEKRLIVVRGVESLNAGDTEYLCGHVLHRATSEEIVLALYFTDKIAKKHPVYKALEKVSAKIDESTPYKGDKLTAYVQKMAQDAGSMLTRDSAEALISLGNGDLFHISTELNRVINLFAEEDSITRQMIQGLNTQQEDQKIFGLSEYLLTRKYPQMIQLIYQLRAQGQEGIPTMAYLSSQLRKALLMRDAAERGVSKEEAVEGNAYALSILERQANQRSLVELQQLYAEITELDYQVKFEGLNPFDGLVQLAVRGQMKTS